MTGDVEEAARVLREKGFAAEAQALTEAVNGVYTTSGEAIAVIGAAALKVRASLGSRIPAEAAAALDRVEKELGRALTPPLPKLNWKFGAAVGLAAGLMGFQIWRFCKVFEVPGVEGAAKSGLAEMRERVAKKKPFLPAPALWEARFNAYPHQPTAEVISAGAAQDTGAWAVDEKTNTVFIDCTHTDSRGTVWSSY